MEATIQSNQMDVDKEEARKNPEVPSLPQKRQIWRMPELPPIPQEKPKKRSGKYAQAFGRGHELLLTHQGLSGSREDHRALRGLEPIVVQRQAQKEKELLEEPKSFIHRPEEGVGNDSSLGDRGPAGVYQLQTSSRSVKGHAQRTSEEEERSQEPSRQRQRQSQLAQDPQIGAFSCGQCVQYAQDLSEIHSQRAGEDEQDLSMQLIQEIHFVKHSIDVEIGKLDAKLIKITLDINDLKNNDKGLLK
ncbi:hypothetical protein O181_080346 [Austropuccinia psidii MF-1]|uniref:Uncharacterized protein n=1 Tax=Austropuccinia psidii MF-1 TaxID=1389203 RepID=A0A9Q3FI16_9BASI|nr:hypothetical protein [Austropuccinia psidii MF-1]